MLLATVMERMMMGCLYMYEMEVVRNPCRRTKGDRTVSVRIPSDSRPDIARILPVYRTVTVRWLQTGRIPDDNWTFIVR